MFSCCDKTGLSGDQVIDRADEDRTENLHFNSEVFPNGKNKLQWSVKVCFCICLLWSCHTSLSLHYTLVKSEYSQHSRLWEALWQHNVPLSWRLWGHVNIGRKNLRIYPRGNVLMFVPNFKPIHDKEILIIHSAKKQRADQITDRPTSPSEEVLQLRG